MNKSPPSRQAVTPPLASRGGFTYRRLDYHQFTLKATLLETDRRGRRSLQFLSFHDYHQFPLNVPSLSRTVGDLVSPKNASIFREPMVPTTKTEAHSIRSALHQIYSSGGVRGVSSSPFSRASFVLLRSYLPFVQIPSLAFFVTSG